MYLLIMVIDMDVMLLRDLLHDVQAGKIGIEAALYKLKRLPFENIGFATIDHHRSLRRGFPEVIYGSRKTAEDIIKISEHMIGEGENVLITRVSSNKARVVKEHFSKSDYYPVSRVMTIILNPIKEVGKGKILIVSAGTSDMPVAEEAAITARVMGNDVETLFDVGVAGLHRLLDKMDVILGASVIVVVAGMEGALPSIVAGLVDKPVIAVPTSIGYGASFKGIAALLGMLNSCASGVTVVNIDNGFGAGYAASLINKGSRLES
jgi:pyridinium-3,5-biscarboxylic acid mononucleotide synthase